MFQDLKELPKAAWATIVRWTLVTTALSVIASVIVSSLLLNSMSQGLNGPGLATAIVLPIALGGPMMFYQALRHQQLKLANQKLQVLASTDWLTACLNRRAFTSMVIGHLDKARQARVAGGAFLVVDADHFKVINDHYGHDHGDAALQIMAETIKASVRDGDLVGRIGGEEFGVFLIDADFETAQVVAERIRQSINAAVFAPEGAAHPLSASVGGAFFDRAIAFADLFRIADQRLYGAKQSGRNRVEMVHASDHAPTQLGDPVFG